MRRACVIRVWSSAFALRRDARGAVPAAVPRSTNMPEAPRGASSLSIVPTESRGAKTTWPGFFEESANTCGPVVRALLDRAGTCGLQREDPALRLNVHFHVIVLDGVHLPETESMERWCCRRSPPRRTQGSGRTLGLGRTQ